MGWTIINCSGTKLVYAAKQGSGVGIDGGGGGILGSHMSEKAMSFW